MSKARKFTTCLLLALSVFSLAWSTSSAAPTDQTASAVTRGPQENVSRTDQKMSEAPQAAVFGTSIRAIWGERDLNAVAVSEKTIGGSWSTPNSFEEGTRAQYQWPDIAVTPDGKTHIVYAAGNDIFHRSRANGSTTWSGRTLIGSDNFPNPVRMAAAPDGSLWVVWRDANGTAIRYRRSSNGGLNWSGGDVASQAGNMAAPDVAVGPDSTPHVMWYIRSGTANGSTAWVADWNGSAWIPSTIGDQGGYVADAVVFADNKNTLHTAYRRQSGSDWIIQHASRAPGQAWSNAENVRTTPGDAGYAPGLAVDPNGGVHITWSELNSAGGRDVWYSAKQAGQAFSAPANVSENPGGWNSRSAVVTTTTDGKVTAHVFYQRGVKGQNVDEIYSRSVTPETCGAPSSSPAAPLSLPFKVYLPLIVRGC